MTCVVAVVEGPRVVMGADSAGVSGYFTVERRDPKVFRSGPFLMGFTTSFRMGQLLRYALAPPERHADVEVERYMVTTFVDAVRACLKEGGYATKDKEQEAGGTFLVGYEGRIFEIEDDYQVGEVAHGYAAVGCGREFAYGALHATTGQPARRRVEKALAAASEFSGGVRPPFLILEDR